MILKLLSYMPIFALGCGYTLIIVFCVWISFCFLEMFLIVFTRVNTYCLLIRKYNRFAELYYKALTYIPDPDKVIRSELKRQWEEELCQK